MIYLLVILFVIFGIVFYFKIKLEYIHKKRMRIISEDYKKIKEYISYEDMIFKKFWIWDIEKMKRRN